MLLERKEAERVLDLQAWRLPEKAPYTCSVGCFIFFRSSVKPSDTMIIF
jgi:hypothetical protein